MARSNYVGRGGALWLREEAEIARERTERIDRTKQALTVVSELDSVGFELWYAEHCPAWLSEYTKMVIAEERAAELLKAAMNGLSWNDVADLHEIVYALKDDHVPFIVEIAVER